MNLLALLSGIIFMMHPIEKFKIPHDCHEIESAIENIAYGQFITLHHDQDTYSKLTALLEETHKILDCDDKIVEYRSHGHHTARYIKHQYYMIQRHHEHCPEIINYLEENKNIDPVQLSNHEQETFYVMQEMGKDLQCDKECYQFIDMLDMYSHKK